MRSKETGWFHDGTEWTLFFEMKEKYSIKDMQVIAARRDGRCLSKEYIDSKTSMTWQCALGHEPFEATFNNVSRGHWCNKCAGNKKKTIKDMNELAAIRGGKCLSKEYINTKIKLVWQCRMGHEPFSMRPNNVQQGQWCPECGGVKKLTIADLNNLAAEHGGRCLTKHFKNNKSLVSWECTFGHRFKSAPNHVQQGRWCEKCYPRKNKKRTIKDLRRMARDRGGELLSTKYRDNKTELLWRCAEGHEFRKRANTIQQGLSWCSECKVLFREQFVRECFEIIFEDEFPKVRPSWLSINGRKNMELDGYNRGLKLAFEHHGIQHYETVPFFHSGKKDLARQVKIDREKRSLCRDHEVTLVEVPYNIPIKSVYSFILDELDKAGFSYPEDAIGSRPSPETVHLRTEIARLREAASEYGHTLLSNDYRGASEPLVFGCHRGHKFKRRPINFHRGQTNCPECIGLKRLTIEQMSDYAKTRGAICLSTSYKNNKAQLEWYCLEHDHRFSLAWNKVKSSDRWCKFCKKF